MLVDTHTHIYLPDLSSSIDEIILRANENGIQQFFLPNIDEESIDAVFALAIKYPTQCYPMMGLHPCSVDANYEQKFAVIKQAALSNKIYAIGEIGMDLYWDKTFEQQQKLIFVEQIKLAKSMSLPIVIHCRKAFDETLAILKSEQSTELRGIFHCFSGTLAQAKKIIEMGFYLGIGGVLTYKNAGLAEVVKEIDLAHLVLETDSPYLSPVPFRGKPNESSYMIHVAEKLAEIKSCTLAEIAAQTTANSKNIFGI